MPKGNRKVKKEEAKTPINPRDFENMEEQEILNQVKQDMDVSSKFQLPYFDKFKRYYQLYRSYIDEEQLEENKKNFRSSLFIPYVFHIIETITPKLVLGIFNSRPYIQTMPLGVDNSIRTARANKMNKLLDYQFNHPIKLVPIITDVLKASAMYGTAITKQSWNFKKRKAVKRQPKEINILGASFQVPGMFENVLVETVTNDDPQVQHIPILDFFFDPAATTIEDGRYCIYRYWEDYDVIKAKSDEAPDNYMNIDKLKDAKAPIKNGTDDDMLSNIGLGSSDDRKKGIEIWEYWTDDWVILVANHDMVIYSGMNPYFHMRKPFAVWKYDSVPNEFYGIGATESIEYLQTELNTTRNQRIDNTSLVLNKMYKVVRGANVDAKQLISRPGGFVEVDDPNDVTEMAFTDVTSSSYNEESSIKNDIDRTTGIHDTERGSTPTRRETATTMSILANAGTERFKLKNLNVEYSGVHDMANQIIWLNQQYIDRDKEILIIGDDGSVDTDIVSPAEIQHSYAIVAVGSSIEPQINKEQQQTQLVQLYNIVQQNPNVNQQELLRRIFEAFNMKNIDQLLVTMQPPNMVTPQVGTEPAGNITNLGGITG